MKFSAKIRFFFKLTLLSGVFFSCDPNEKLPPETILEFVGFQRFADSTGLARLDIQINFQSGTGNIGLDSTETGKPPYVAPFDKNLFVHVFDKVSLTDTIFVPLQTETFPSEDFIITYTIPILEGNPGVRGTFDVHIFKPVPLENMQRESKHGIVRFEIYMLDRDLVRSYIKTHDGEIIQANVVTPEISIR
jgi:hypothetical protein